MSVAAPVSPKLSKVDQPSTRTPSSTTTTTAAASTVASESSASKSKEETGKKDASSPKETAEASESKDDEEVVEGVIDMETFMQILDLDEDETHDFSREMVAAYFTQATSTFTDIDDALAAKDLKQLSELGHFLKGSSATLGVTALQLSCEKIQHYGKLNDEETGEKLTSEVALAKIAGLMGQVKKDYQIAEKWLRQWYKDNSDSEIS